MYIKVKKMVRAEGGYNVPSKHPSFVNMDKIVGHCDLSPFSEGRYPVISITVRTGRNNSGLKDLFVLKLRKGNFPDCVEVR